MGKLEWRISLNSTGDVDDLMKRAGSFSGITLAKCDACKKCGPSLTHSSDAIPDIYQPEEVIFQITGDKAGTRECPLVSAQN